MIFPFTGYWRLRSFLDENEMKNVIRIESKQRSAG